MYNCEICNAYLSSKYTLKSHKAICHSKQTIKNEPVVLPTNCLNLSCGEVKFKHPFTCAISGSSKCGKTEFLRRLLNSKYIQPPPERVIVLYKRWQPLYDKIKDILPKPEFYRGIPENIDSDSIFDVSKRNLVIFDDLMTDTSTDKAVSELFTEGSHHRNLSVINLTQNLFPRGKSSTTQRRNTQYLVLFKSPMGQDQIQTIGRFMFPGKVKDFMKVYSEATSKPYGHLVVDTNEPIETRLKSNVFDSSRTSCKPDVKSASEFNQSAAIRREQNTSDESSTNDVVSLKQNKEREEPIKANTLTYFPHLKQNYNCEVPTNMAHSCDDCGTLFETSHDLQQHLKNWCPERATPAKMLHTDDFTRTQDFVKTNASSDDGPSMDPEQTKKSTEAELAIFREMFANAAQENRSEKKYKIQKYMEQGLEKADAIDKAEDKMAAESGSRRGRGVQAALAEHG